MSGLTRPLLVAALLLILPVTVLPAAPSTGKAFVIGRISENPNKHYPGAKAMADYLASRMKNLGITEGRVIMTENPEQMAQHIKAGNVDLVSDTVIAAVQLADDAGAEIFLKSRRKGAGSYRAVFFTRKDSGINSLADLRGHIIAFEDRYSTTGFVIPAATLIMQKFELAQLESPRDPVPPGRIGYVFSGSEEINSALMVHKRIVHASVVSNIDMTQASAMPPEIRDDMRVLYETADFPRSLVLVRRNLTPAIKTRLRQLLLKAPTDPEAESILKDFHAITQFETLSKSDLAGIEEGRRLAHVVRAKLK